MAPQLTSAPGSAAAAARRRARQAAVPPLPPPPPPGPAPPPPPSLLSKLAFWSVCSLSLLLAFLLLAPPPPLPRASPTRRAAPSTPTRLRRRMGRRRVEKKVQASARARRPGSRAASPSSSPAPQASSAATPPQRCAAAAADIADAELLAKLFDVAPFTSCTSRPRRACAALVDPMSYVRANVAGLVALLEAARAADPQPAIVWASSSSVYGLNSHVPFSEHDRTDRPASLYAATKKAGEEIAHVYNHIYGLSLTALGFTVYGPWGRPDMAYFFFTRDILAGRPITVYESSGGGTHQTTISRDFTYIDDIVKGCIGALDTAGRSTGSGNRSEGQRHSGHTI
ncbi:hypothetical protein ZWY2020_007989 [Hordeum vulgare]|nr:hypothetical protein ZWY2020_007989 [Hordeum vulgare]